VKPGKDKARADSGGGRYEHTWLIAVINAAALI